MASQPLHAGNTLGEINVTPHQENQRVCTRSSPCLQQGCLLCYAPPSHVRNLDVDLNSSNASSSTPSKPLPQPPDDHPIALLTFAFQNAIQTNDIDELEAVTHLYTNSLQTNMDFIKYDRSTLNSLRLAAKKLLTSHIAVNTPLPSTPPNGRTSDQHNPTYPACFKPPKITTDTWNGESYDFYPWLASVLNGFELTGCADRAKLTLTLQAIPIDKKGPLNNITNWDEFKIRLVDEYGSIDVFGREVNRIFDLLPYYETVQEIAEDLSPKIKRLQSNLLIIQQFHDVEDLNSVALTQHLIHNIMRRIPKEVKGDFNKEYMKFRNQSAANVRPPASFAFIAQFVNEIAKNYRSNPDLYDSEYATPSLGVKPVRHGSPKTSPILPSLPQTNPNITPKRPCTLCSEKGFENNHFPLNRHCGVAKLSSKDILKLIDKLQACSTCTHTHEPTYKCRTTFHSGGSKVCTTGCLHNGLPLHRRACKHKDQAPSITVSKVSTNKSVPLVENIPVGNTHVGIQYDTGCQLSLILQSALSTIPNSMYTLGPSSKVRLVTYAGEGKTILTTEVKLRLHGKILRLSVIEENLNNGAGFTLSVPFKWRSIAGVSTSHHDGQISILLGGDNHLAFPTEVERDAKGMALYLSNLTGNYILYGSAPANTITWEEPTISPSPNTMFVKLLSVQDLQDHLLFTTSAEDFTCPSNREKLLKITKEKRIKDIMANTTVNTSTNKTSVVCLYKENLPELGENYYGAIKRTTALHNKIYKQPDIAAEMDKYIQGQIDVGNYIELHDLEEERKIHQLHFVAYNFVVSSTSSSTKVRMTTDSSMCTESGLSLNDVTQPAPGDVPNLRGILMRSRSHPYYAVFDIKKFFRSVLISDKDSYLRIICVPTNFFSNQPTLNPTWRYFRDRAIPFGDSASGDYATCAKVATVQTFIKDSPPSLQPLILQAVLEDTYIDDGGVGAQSVKELSEAQHEIESILNKGGFLIKSWECSGEDGSSKYLGMTWDRLKDCYLLKFRLNLHKKTRGIPAGEDLDSKFLHDHSTPITKKNVLSVACQFYDPTGLAAPLMFSVRSMFSELCRDPTCSFNSILSEERTKKFRTAVNEILLTRGIYFPRQVIFNYSAQLFIFFDGSLQGYGACVYAFSNNQFNLIYSSAKIKGKAAFSAPQSEIAGAVLATRMEQKITQELFNVNLSPPTFIGDSEIILKMIAKNDPASPPGSMVQDSWRLQRFLLLKIGSGVLVISTQLTCLPDLVQRVNSSTPSSGSREVFFQRINQLGPSNLVLLFQHAIYPADKSISSSARRSTLPKT